MLDTQTATSDSGSGVGRTPCRQLPLQLRARDSDVAGILPENGPAAAEQSPTTARPAPLMLPDHPGEPVECGARSGPPTGRISSSCWCWCLMGSADGAGHFTRRFRETNSPYKGAYIDFNLNLNLPSPGGTGFLPPQQMRSASAVDYPDRPAGELYCRVPQDSTLDYVRGFRNIPCETRPGKRAPTVKMCESDDNYVPLNDGFNWKGDPNATVSGQDVPQLPPGSPPMQVTPQPPPPLAVAEYDPATGTYVGPDGNVYTQSDLAHSAKGKSWQSMLTPPSGN